MPPVETAPRNAAGVHEVAGVLLREVLAVAPLTSGYPRADGAQSAREQVALTLITNSRLLRDGLLALLAPHLDVRLVGSFTGQPCPMAAPLNPAGHVVLLDGSIGQDSMVRWARFWRSLTPPALVLAIELEEDPPVLLACIEAGVSGYTLQGAAAADVADAIVGLQRGIATCSPTVVASLFARLEALGSDRGTAAPPPTSLTHRELEILSYVNQDYSNQEIAAILVIEVRTVKHHVHNVLQKLKLRHRWDAARVAVERGWLTPTPKDQQET